jgi:hypothetical protein
VAFTKVLTMYQIYHTWIHPLPGRGAYFECWLSYYIQGSLFYVITSISCIPLKQRTCIILLSLGSRLVIMSDIDLLIKNNYSAKRIIELPVVFWKENKVNSV